MRLSPLLMLTALAACDLAGITGASVQPPHAVELRTEAAPAGTARVVTVQSEFGRIVVRGVFDVPPAHELYGQAQVFGTEVVVLVRAADVPGAGPAPTGLLRYQATLGEVPRGTYVVRVQHHVQGEPVNDIPTAALDTITVP